MLTLHLITSGIRNGRHQQYPTSNIPARPVASQTEAEESAVRLLRAHGSISCLRLTDANGTEIREYRRGDFFQRTSPLRDVHHRVVDQDLADRATEK